MPAPSLKALADRAGITPAKAEKLWDKAKQIATDNGFKEGEDDFYAYTTGAVKRMLGIKDDGSAIDRVAAIKDSEAAMTTEAEAAANLAGLEVSAGTEEALAAPEVHKHATALGFHSIPNSERKTSAYFKAGREFKSDTGVDQRHVDRTLKAQGYKRYKAGVKSLYPTGTSLYRHPDHGRIVLHGMKPNGAVTHISAIPRNRDPDYAFVEMASDVPLDGQRARMANDWSNNYIGSILQQLALRKEAYTPDKTTFIAMLNELAQKANPLLTGGDTAGDATMRDPADARETKPNGDPLDDNDLNIQMTPQQAIPLGAPATPLDETNKNTAEVEEAVKIPGMKRRAAPAMAESSYEDSHRDLLAAGYSHKHTSKQKDGSNIHIYEHPGSKSKIVSVMKAEGRKTKLKNHFYGTVSGQIVGGSLSNSHKHTMSKTKHGEKAAVEVAANAYGAKAASAHKRIMKKGKVSEDAYGNFQHHNVMAIAAYKKNGQHDMVKQHERMQKEVDSVLKKSEKATTEETAKYAVGAKVTVSKKGADPRPAQVTGAKGIQLMVKYTDDKGGTDTVSYGQVKGAGAKDTSSLGPKLAGLRAAIASVVETSNKNKTNNDAGTHDGNKPGPQGFIAGKPDHKPFVGADKAQHAQRSAEIKGMAKKTGAPTTVAPVSPPMGANQSARHSKLAHNIKMGLQGKRMPAEKLAAGADPLA